MSTQQDIYAAGSENRPPMLNKENYVPWSSRLLRYAKSRPNGKLIYNSIMNGPYVREDSEPSDQAIQNHSSRVFLKTLLCCSSIVVKCSGIMVSCALHLMKGSDMEFKKKRRLS
ncbi:hypothetical protein Tco_0954667 [Tanacetum coccineum]|uniref:Uncharacterized protein n=1 Tax=Tanacetum coccineum TaxID=301880 RepID=A0ABQ5E517_9ASTR